MKAVERLGELLNQPICAELFDIHHQFKSLKIEINNLQTELRQSKNDKYIMEQHLNATIKELARTNEKLRKIRRRELKENQKKYLNEATKMKVITDSMTSSIAFIDTNYTYQYINKKYTEWFGLKSEDILGKTIADVAGEAFFSFQKTIYDKVLAGEQFDCEIDTKVYNTNKRLVCHAHYVPAVDSDNNIIGLYAYGTNITELKVKEELLRNSKTELKKSNEKLKKYIESNVQLEQFAFVAAHDMKAPLRSINSFTGLLEKSFKNQLDKRQKGYINYISEGTRQMFNLITDLLDYSKIDSKQLELADTDINEVVNQVTKYLRQTIQETQANIIVEELPKQVFVDKIKMYQVFQNLIANGVKFSKSGHTPEIHISYKDIGAFHEFSVRDNGIGIDKQYHTEIFESFKQVNNKSEYQGTGLGLSICKRIIEDHKGQITLESQIGQGSCFIFTIPKNLNN